MLLCAHRTELLETHWYPPLLSILKRPLPSLWQNLKPVRRVLPDKAERLCDPIPCERKERSSFLCADVGFFFFVVVEGEQRLQRTRSPGREPTSTANREAAICFSFRFNGRDSLYSGYAAPSCLCFVPERWRLWAHTHIKNSNTQELTVPEEGEWELDDLGGLSDWLKAYGLQLKSFQPVLDVPSVILGLCLVCRDLLKRKKKNNLISVSTVSSGCWQAGRGIFPSSLGCSPDFSRWRHLKLV